MEHFMTSEELAELLHVDPVTIRRLVNKGELSAYRIGADYRFAPSELLNRFDRFTKRARHVLVLAQEESQSFQHNAIDTEHLLLGLLREGEGVAAQVLNNLGIETDQVRHAVEAIVGRGEQIVRGEMALNPRTKKVFEFALDEAQRLNHHCIGTEHLPLGLIREGEGIAARALKSLGLQLEQVRTEILRILHQHQQEQEQESTLPSVPAEATTLLAEIEPGLSCTSCGAHCPDYFRYCFNCGQPLIREDASREEEG